MYPYNQPERRPSLSMRSMNDACDEGFFDVDIDALAATSASNSAFATTTAVSSFFPNKLTNDNIVSPEKTVIAQKEREEEEEAAAGGGADKEVLFYEPYHDLKTNRTIMRMRMGSLMDHDDDGGDDEDETLNHLHQMKQEEKPTWTMFEKGAFEDLSRKASNLFSRNNNINHDEDEKTSASLPIDKQVSFKDPYNAWNLLPAPFNSISSRGRNPYNLFSYIRQELEEEEEDHKKRRRQKTMIDKQGWPEDTKQRSTTLFRIKPKHKPKLQGRKVSTSNQTVPKSGMGIFPNTTPSTVNPTSNSNVESSSNHEVIMMEKSSPNYHKKEDTTQTDQAKLNDDVNDNNVTLVAETNEEREETGKEKPRITGCIESQLAMYVEMVAKESDSKSCDNINELLQKDTNLSKRERIAFLMGMGLYYNNNDEKKKNQEAESTKPANRNNETTHLVPDEPDYTVITASSQSSIFVSPRMRARASKRSVAVEAVHENKSYLMKIVKNKETMPSYDNGDARTSISARSTLSCRELSIQRLQRRIAYSRKEEESKVKELLKELQEAQNRQKRLEQQLSKAGITIAEDIPYQVAKSKVAKIAEQMQAIGHSQVQHPDAKVQNKLRQEYFVLEQEMEKYITALEMTDEYLQEQERQEQKFDDENNGDNTVALQQIWKHMPVDIRQKSIDEWLRIRSPNGILLPKVFLVKFSRTNILTLLRMNPEFIVRAHPCNLEQRRVTGLTLTERRALQAFLQPIAHKYWRNSKDSLTKRKWNWYVILRQTFKDHLASYKHHVSNFGLDQEGFCQCHGLQCPVKVNQKLNYFKEDYGYPCNIAFPEYEELSNNACTSQTSKCESSLTKNKDPGRGRLLSEIITARAAKDKF